MEDTGKQIYEMLLDFYNNSMNWRQKNLNLVLSPTVFYAEYDYLLQELCKEGKTLPFSVTWFRFTEIEIDLLGKFAGSNIYRRAKKRLEQVKQAETFSAWYYFNNPMEIVQTDRLDAPICIISSSINETIWISLQSGWNRGLNVYQVFDGYEKSYADKEELKLAECLLEIKKASAGIDPEATKLRFNGQVKNELPADVRFILDEQFYSIREDTVKIDNGGESSVYSLKADKTKAVKLFSYSSENKAAKLKFLLTKAVQARPFADFCVLPKSLVWSESKKIIGYAMDCVDGLRLDRYFCKMVKNESTSGVDVIWLFLQIAVAVYSVHLSDLIIGDLHYSNFLVTQDGKIKIIDCDSFQILCYPCDGRRIEADEFKKEYHTADFDCASLRTMYKALVDMCPNETRKDSILGDYYAILNTYTDYVRNVPGFIYAFYYFLHERGEV